MKILDKIGKANLNAILVTVLIHLVLLFVVLLLQLNPPPQNTEAVVLIDPENLEEMEKYFEAKEKVEEKMKELAEQKNMSLEDIKNLAISDYNDQSKNQNQSEKDKSLRELKEQYEDEIRKEMYGDKYEDIKAELDKQISRDSITGYIGETNEEEKQGDESYYSGPSLVKVELEDKELKHYYVEIPVFTCKGSGIVIISINIDKFGNVIKTELLSQNINSDEACLIKAAKNAALNSRFEPSPKGSQGTITYQFVAQN